MTDVMYLMDGRTSEGGNVLLQAIDAHPVPQLWFVSLVDDPHTHGWLVTEEDLPVLCGQIEHVMNLEVAVTEFAQVDEVEIANVRAVLYLPVLP